MSTQIYANENYGGASILFWGTNPAMTTVYGTELWNRNYDVLWWKESWNDELDSVRTSKEWQTTLYEHSYSRGASKKLWPRSSYGSLGSWGDKASSITFKRFDGFIVYANTNFGGSKHWWWCNGNTATRCGLSYIGDSWNDRISSMSVGGCNKITLYEHPNYQGKKVEFVGESHWPSFVAMNVNDVFSSFIIERVCNVA
jgi:hypothetical protein